MEEFPFDTTDMGDGPCDRAERLVTLIAAAMADEGWYGRHRLIRVVGDPDDPDFELGFLELDEGEHPLKTIFGLVAPPEWWAIGLVTYGWAATMAGDLDDQRGTYFGQRPSQAPDRQRVRQVVLVTRDSCVASTASLEDGRVMDESGVGIVLDCLRRVVGVATDPPAGDTSHLWSSLWLGQVIGQANEDGRRLNFKQAAACHPAYRLLKSDTGAHPKPGDLLETGAALARGVPWPKLRALTVEGKFSWALRIEPEVAAWCDEGLFSRLVMSETPPMNELLFLLRRAVTASTGRQITEVLDAWGVLDDPSSRADGPGPEPVEAA